MRIMLDTSVLLAELLLPMQKYAKLMRYTLTEHTAVLPSFVTDELMAVTKQYFPKQIEVVDSLLTRMSFDLVWTPQTVDESRFRIPDAKDYPVLYAALVEDVDIIVTLDRDFRAVEVERPRILTPDEFTAEFVNAPPKPEKKKADAAAKAEPEKAAKPAKTQGKPAPKQETEKATDKPAPGKAKKA